MPTQTTIVAVTFTLNSLDSPAPYEVTGCAGTITYSDASTQPFSGWNALNIGTPEPNGATFNLSVTDADYDNGTNQSGVANWALTFIPRAGTAHSSPVHHTENTITGSGGTNTNGTFALNLGGKKIKYSGNWDWSLMIQMTLPDGTVKCFSSDPEMEVGS